MHISHAKALLKALFVGDDPLGGGGSGTGGGGGGLMHEQQHAPRFGGLFGGSSSSYSHSNPLDQAPAPLLTLLESKVFPVLLFRIGR